MNKLKKIFGIVAFVLAYFVLSFGTLQINAQFDACDFVNCESTSGETPEERAGGVDDALRFGASSIFGLIVAYGVIIIIRAAIGFIRSEGAEDKITDSKNKIKSVFIGIGIIFLGILGLVILFAVTGLEGAANVEISAPDGVLI